MIDYTYTMVHTTIYVVLLNLFVGTFVVKRNINPYIFFGLQGILIAWRFGMSFLLEDQFGFKLLSVAIADTIVVCSTYEVKMRKSMVLAVLYQGCEVAIEYFALIILQNSFGLKSDELLENLNLSFSMGLLCLMIMFCVIMIIRKSFSKKMGYLLTELEWLRFSAFPIFCLITIVALMLNFELVGNGRQGLILIWIVGGLVVMNILVFGLLTDALKRESELTEYKVIQERGKNNTEMYQSAIKNYNEQRKIVHEFKNHMECISSLLQQGEYERVNKYISQIQVTMNQNHDLMDTNNKLVNVILNSKYIEATEKNILFVVKANDLSSINMEDQDLVIVLSNLINNAIEACEKSEKKVIKLKIVRENKRLIVSATNSYDCEPVKEAGKYITSKSENIQYHGIGIENIKEVVERYQGTYAIKCENNEFLFSILLPM